MKLLKLLAINQRQPTRRRSRSQPRPTKILLCSISLPKNKTKNGKKQQAKKTKRQSPTQSQLHLFDVQTMLQLGDRHVPSQHLPRKRGLPPIFVDKYREASDSIAALVARHFSPKGGKIPIYRK